MASHPHVTNRQGSQSDQPRVLAYAREPARTAWIEEELAKEALILKFAQSVDEAVRILVDDPPPRPQVLVVDVEGLAAADVAKLHVIREQGWFGTVLILGNLALAARKSLNVERVIMPPFAKNSLRNAVMQAGVAQPTMKIPKIVK
jgi:hypothetical protein